MEQVPRGDRGVGGEVPVGQFGALGRAGGTGRVEDDRGIRRGPVDRAGNRCPVEVRADEIAVHVRRFMNIFEQLSLTEDEKERIWYRNAAEICGLETPTYAAE